LKITRDLSERRKLEVLQIADRQKDGFLATGSGAPDSLEGRGGHSAVGGNLLSASRFGKTVHHFGKFG
jgi:hypothetical protein